MRQFNTLAFFRCTEKQFADAFCTNGNIKFNTPKYWIELEAKEGKGRGDSLEGIYSSVHMLDVNTIIESNSLRSSIQREVENGIIYFRSSDILSLPCFCLFGLNSTAFSSEGVDKRGIKYYIYRVTKKYFNDFSDNNRKEFVKNLPEERRPVLVIIKNPNEFIERVRNYFIKKGIKPEEILIEPIEYLNKKEPFISTREFPNELFLKDNSFSYQSEIRIIINTKNQLLLKELEENNNIVNIGSLQDITVIEDFYYDDDMLLEIGDNKLSYKLPEPKITNIDDYSKEELLELIDRITNDEIEIRDGIKTDALDAIEEILRTKFNIHNQQ